MLDDFSALSVDPGHLQGLNLKRSGNLNSMIPRFTSSHTAPAETGVLEHPFFPLFCYEKASQL